MFASVKYILFRCGNLILPADRILKVFRYHVSENKYLPYGNSFLRHGRLYNIIKLKTILKKEKQGCFEE